MDSPGYTGSVKKALGEQPQSCMHKVPSTNLTAMTTMAIIIIISKRTTNMKMSQISRTMITNVNTFAILIIKNL